MKTGHKRLLALADFLDTIPPARFNYDVWGEYTDDAEDRNLGKLKSLDVHQCNTTGCALGWGTAMQRFRRLGLHLEDGEPVLGFDRYSPRGTNAAAALFDLSYEDADYLFIPGHGEGYQTPPSHVAEKIRNYVGEMS